MHIIKWFHHLFNPHCAECAHDAQCKNCEMMRELLEKERYEKHQLLEKLLHQNDPPVMHEQEPIELPKPKPITWSVRKQMLETESRLAAKAMKEANSELTEELEKELLNANQ